MLVCTGVGGGGSGFLSVKVTVVSHSLKNYSMPSSQSRHVSGGNKLDFELLP